MKDFRFGGVWIFVFEAGLKTPTTTAGHGGRDYCGRSGLRLSEASHESIREGDGELGHRLRPVPGTATPVCGDVLQRHPDQLGCGLIAREVSSGLDDLAQPRIDALDRIGGVDHATYRRGKGKERNDPIPCSTPQRRDGRVPFAPGSALEFLECFQDRLRVGRGVDRPQRLGEGLAVLPACVFEAVTDQMDDARLQGRGRKCRAQGLWNTLETIGDGDQDVPDSAGLEVVEHLQPEFSSLGVLDPDPQDVARAIGQHAEGEVNRLVAHHRLLADLHPQRIEEHHRIHRLERAALPGADLGHHRIRDGADELGGDLRAVLRGEKSLDLPRRHAAGVHGDDLVVESGEAPLVLADQHRLEAPLTVAGDIDPQRTVLGQHRLGARPIAVIARRLGLLSAGEVPEVMGESSAPRQRSIRAFLNALEAALTASALIGTLDALVDQLRGQDRQGGIGRRILLCTWHMFSRFSCYASHTNFWTLYLQRAAT